ncbi:branched-chain amino acid ABC transporter permease [Catenuloplanes atrovinosus]|nr:branched-chain amino acid ABC transporter permease [Catenuloplanes atrovinosus]
MFTALLGALFFALGVNATSAYAAEGEGLQGTLSNQNQPVAGVRINVTQNGQPAGSAVSGADGKWTLSVSPGTYEVVLDESSLPAGVGLQGTLGPTRSLEVYEGQMRNVLYPLGPVGAGAPPPEAEPTIWDRLPNLVYTGVHIGLILALGALGVSLIFGTMGLTNFAHGELITFGALIGFLFNVTIGLPLWLSLILAVVVGGAFGWLQDRFFWGWLRRRRTGLIGMMIVSIGLAMVLRYVFLFQFRGGTQQYREYAAQPGIEIGPLLIAPKNLIMDAVAILVLVAVSVALLKTRLGKATRAVSTNPALAAASGIDVDKIIRLIWTIGGALAALAGVMLGMFQGLNFQMGFQILLLVFAAVTLGGLGTAFGALLGSMVVGIVTQVSTLWVPTELKNVGALAALIIILLFRPQGILGRRERIG